MAATCQGEIMSGSTRVNKVNILLVDDQPSKLLTYESILSELGENILTASSATEALDCLLRTEIAVVLVDVCMPDLDGYELASMIRQHPRFQKTSIIFVSAVVMTDLDRLRGYESGGGDYVPVPIVPEILRAKVSVFAELYRKTRALERLNAELERRVSERTAALEASTAALKDADRRKDEFLAMLAHELRNPLAPISTAVQLLRLKELSDAQRERARDVLERQVQHLVLLVDDLLDVSRITRGVITLQHERVLIGTVIARAVETARPMIDSRRHTLTLDLNDEVLAVEGDKARLVQVVGNILNNAAKFMEPGGKIQLKVAREGTSVAITVKDAGIGIPSDQVPRIFDLFTQVHAKPDQIQGGLGVGLALVRRLVEMHGGTVAAHSAGSGQGTDIIVRLPLWAMQAVRPEEPRHDSPVPAIGPSRILVVDDHLDAVEALSMQLQVAGHDVRTANDGVEAMTIGETFQPQVVLLDLGMPRMDGYETARSMRRRPWGTRALIIAVTGWAQPYDRQKTSEAGFDAHLVKPVSEVELFQAIATGRLTKSENAESPAV
jgi:signal transduction histidine kinase